MKNRMLIPALAAVALLGACDRGAQQEEMRNKTGEQGSVGDVREPVPADKAAVGARNEASKAMSDASPSGTQSGSNSASSADQSSDTGKKISAGIQDTTVTTKVKAALLADEQVKGNDIKVETKEGAVTLSGRVDSADQKQRAEQLAMNIEGVRTVENRIATPQ
jgi:hyperosmotically inducible protein